MTEPAKKKSILPPVIAGLGLVAVLAASVWWVKRDARPVAERPAPTAESAAPSTPPAPKPPFTLSALSPEPAWEELAGFAETLTPATFRDAMTRIYADGTPAWESLFRFPADPPAVEWLTASKLAAAPTGDTAPPAWQPLSFAESDRLPLRYWREAAQLPPATDPDKPLEGVRVALDPGHIGGVWAKMEQRWYQPPGEPTAVMEGEMTLTTARLLKPQLEALGAIVFLVRDQNEPVTAFRASDFTEQTTSVREAENYFYRKAEIRARADRINRELQPDLVVCLHFNAEPWGEPGRVTFVEANHLHLLVNGHYSPDEMALDDVRYEMLQRLLQRSHEEELRLADAVARSLAAATGLPPYDYGRGHMAKNAHRPLPENPYVWARNLMANRLYQCPVIFTEPYVMNSREVYERVVAGDYEGEKLVAGRLRPSLYREYAEGVAKGLRAHFAAYRPTE